jgi:hypothetical protein
MDGCYLYAIRLVRHAQGNFNLCPADVCAPLVEGQGVPGALVASPTPDLASCPVDAVAKPEFTVTQFDPPQEAIDTVLRLARAASIDIGGVEYLVSVADRQIYFYDINATSNFVAKAPVVLGWDPFPPFVVYIVWVATRTP